MDRYDWAYLQLTLALEHPDSQLRRPPGEWSPAAAVLQRCIDVLSILEELGWDAEMDAVIARLYALSTAELESMAAALDQAGGRALLRPLKRWVGALRFVRGGRERTAAQALERALEKPLVMRLYGRALERAYQTLATLADYAQAHGLLMTEAAAHADASVLPTPAEPPPAPPLRDPMSPRIVILNWDRAHCAQLIDAWLALMGGAQLVSQAGAAPMQSFSTVEQSIGPKRLRDNLPSGHAIGVLRAGRAVPDLKLPPRPQSPEQWLAEMLHAFEWALISLPLPFREFRQFALLSDRPHLACRFIQLASELGFQSLLVGVLDDPHLLGSQGRGALFGECSEFGEAALIAAGDAELPLIAVRFAGYMGCWWRQWTQRCECLAMRMSAGEALAIYRAPDRDVFRALWSRIGYDANIAFLAVPGDSDAQQVLSVLASAYYVPVETYSARFGWAYLHRWGGGADEHYAEFYAEDAATTQRVYAYAASRVKDGWRLVGRWTAPVRC